MGHHHQHHERQREPHHQQHQERQHEPHQHQHEPQPCETTPLLHHHSDHQNEKPLTACGTLICTFVFLIIIVFSFLFPTAIILKSFSFSHLRITDHQISADLEIGLVLYNSANDTANYTDFRYTVVYCGDPNDQRIVDAHKQFNDLILPPRERTVVYLKDSVENLVLNQLALSFMTMDVIRDGIVDFDLVVRVTAMAGKNKKRYLMNCGRIGVTIWSYSYWTWNKHNILDGSGYARNTSNCYSTEI